MAVKELTKTQRTIALITVVGLFIYAIVNAFLVIYAYSKLSKNVDQLQDFVANWKVGAITDIQASASCSTGYEPLFQDRSWYGVDNGCYCGTGVSSADRENFNITCSPFCSSSCSATFTSKGCTNVAGRSAVELSYWGIVGSTPTKICIKRSKETWATQAPLLNSDGTCPAGYTTCGTSTDYKFCTKETNCPITSISWASTCSGSNCVVVDNTGVANNKAFTFTRGNDVGGDGIPLAEFRVNENGMCDTKEEDDITPSRPNFALLKRKISTCNNEGAAQWLSGSSLSTISETRLFQLHSLDTYIASLSPYTTPTMTGYYSNSASGNSYSWKLFGRNYIPFKNECREDMKSLLSKSEALTNLKTAQTALLVIGLISTAILGIALSYMEIQNLRGVDLSCIDGKGEAERKKLKKIKKIMTYAFKFLVIPFQIWAIALTGTTKGLFGKVGSGNCSNDMYNGIFSYFGETLKSSYSSNITAIALTVVTLLVDIVLAWWDDRKAKKEAQKVNSASVTNRHNNSEKEEIINLDNTVNMNSPVKTPNQPLNQQSQFASPGLSHPNSAGVVINIGGNGIAQQEVPQQAYAQQQFAQPQPQFVQPQPQFAQPQYVQPQPQAQQNPFGQPQAQQNPFGQPQFAQQQYPQQQFAPQQNGVQERSNPFGQR